MTSSQDKDEKAFIEFKKNNYSDLEKRYKKKREALMKLLEERYKQENKEWKADRKEFGLMASLDLGDLDLDLDLGDDLDLDLDLGDDDDLGLDDDDLDLNLDGDDDLDIKGGLKLDDDGNVDFNLDEDMDLELVGVDDLDLKLDDSEQDKLKKMLDEDSD